MRFDCPLGWLEPGSAIQAEILGQGHVLLQASRLGHVMSICPSFQVWILITWSRCCLTPTVWLPVLSEWIFSGDPGRPCEFSVPDSNAPWIHHRSGNLAWALYCDGCKVARKLFHFNFLAIPHCLWDLGSPTRDLTWPPAVEGWNPNHWSARKVPKLCNGVDSMLQLNGCEFEQIPGDGEGHGSLLRCSPRGHKSRMQLIGWTTTKQALVFNFTSWFFSMEYFKCSIFSLS